MKEVKEVKEVKEISLVTRKPSEKKISPSKHSLFSIESIKYYESHNYHPLKTPIFIITIIVVLLYSFIQGTTYIESILNIEKCSWVQFLVMGIALIIIFIINIASIIIVYKEQTIKKMNNHQYDHELEFTILKIVFLSLFSFFVGFLAYLLGMGGGLFLIPMMNSIGIDPLVSSSTVMFMILLSKTVSTVLAITSGFLNYDYIIIAGIFIILFSITFLCTLDQIIKKLTIIFLY